MEGVGLHLRDAFLDDLAAAREAPIDFLEVTVENAIERGPRATRALDSLAERFTILPHGVSLSLGGLDPLDVEYLDAIAGLVKRFRAPYWSEHLGCVKVGGVFLHAVVPPPRTDEVVEHVAKRARAAEARVGAPLVLENLAQYCDLEGSTKSEGEYLADVASASGCGLLVDVANIVIDAENFGFDPLEVVDAIPIERVRQIHLAGHDTFHGLSVDSHSRAVPDTIYAVYRRVIARAGRVVPTILEWEVKIPPLGRLFDEVERARQEARRALAEGQ